MSDFVDIFAEVLRVATFQPREARMRYQLPRCDQSVQAPEGERRLHTQAPALSTCDELLEVECTVVRRPR
ncbi:hypothetical protein SAMN03159463_02635 [Mesorhizobium sp. NFR06]|nr:hypothetical protein SAMN03159463_02635 [Mesorhizobium sp. NFR06]